MNEPLIGSVSSPWPPPPFLQMGWPPSSMAVAGRTLPGTATAVPASSLGPGGLPAVLPLSPGATLPAFAGSEVAVGVPVSALLATVAVRRGQPLGPSNDQEIEDFIYDALELLPGSGEIDLRCEGGRVSLTGTVHNKRLKRDVGEIAWAIPGVNDVHNTIAIAARRRSRGAQGEAQPAAGSRKSA